ncbi:AP-1 complex subunit mu-1 [Blyttiomyces sp. JEL0837]|nr:AP-1 complex subunit mu-1 [Blyttiomyces sp. JEL0837]
MDEDLLNDLEDLDGDEVEMHDVVDEDMGGSGDEMEEDEEEEENGEPAPVTSNDVKKVAHLLQSRKLKDVLEKIEYYKQNPRTKIDPNRPLEEDPEYNLLVTANDLMVQIDNEIIIVHKFIRDHYAGRFPELETLIPNAPLDYARAVKAIGNEMDLMKVDLKAILPPATVMIVTVTATTTNGKPLELKVLNAIFEACDVMLTLESTRRIMLEYVESRMNLLAPNLTAILGSTTAAKILAVAGGLTALSKIPACNLQVLGKGGKMDNGSLFAKGQQKHAGFIAHSDMVQMIPREFRNKATRMIAAKCCLAARIDRARESTDGHAGRTMRDEILKKLEKAQEPPPGKNIKALPVPDEGQKKRRGGKRMRRQKERMAVTEAWKAQNRVKFGEAEEEVIVGDTVKGLGLLGGQTGKVRGITADPSKKLGMTKRHKMISGSGGATSGLSSSLAFTPVQGIELENPDAIAQRKAAHRCQKNKSGKLNKDRKALHMLSAIFILDMKGKVLISRNYRGDIPMSAVEKFMPLILEAEEEEQTPSPVVSTEDGVFTEYFKELEEESIRDNFVIIYELLDEMMDFGYPQTTEPKILQEYITQESYKVESQARPPAAVTNAVSWRSEGIKYRKNEVFLDVIESVNLLVTPAKGKAVELEDIKFHQCVRLSRFENDRTISFIPPDGEFELMSYRLNTQVKPLIWCEAIVESHSGSRIEYMIKAKAQFKRRSTANNVEIIIPVPEDADSPKFKSTVGYVQYAPELNAVVWKIKQFPGGKEFLMRAHFGLPSVKNEDPDKKPPISVKFEIPYFTTSGIQVRYLKVVDKSGYQAFPWVRYITQNGDYFLRMPDSVKNNKLDHIAF